MLGACPPHGKGQVRRGLLAQMLRQAAHRLRPGSLKRLRTEAQPAALELKLELWYLLSLMDFICSRQERHLLLVIRILNEAENHGLAPWIARSCAGVRFPLDAMALGRLAQAYGACAVGLAEQGHDRGALSLADQAVAHHALWVGLWDAAVQHGEASLAVPDEESSSFGRGIAAWAIARP